MQKGECIIDIGSGSVGACIIGGQKGKVTLTQTVRIPISSGTEEAKAGIQTLVVQAVSKALESLKGVAPEHVRIVLAAPWYNAKIRTITSKSAKPVRVTTDTVGRGVKEYYVQKEGGQKTKQAGLIESTVGQAYVNGYPASLKHPVSGTALKINHYESEADPPLVHALEEAVHKVFSRPKISFHSFGFAAFAVLRALRDEDNFVIADVGGEITDVAVVHHDGLRFIGTFPVGTRSLIRTIAGTGSLADAASRLTLYGKNELSNDETTAMDVQFQKASEMWNKGYQEILEAAVKEVAIPRTTFLFADRDELPWLQKMVTGTHGAFSSQSVLITPDFFHSAVSLGEGAQYDAFLSLESLLFRTDIHVLADS